jgi:lysophospholipase L1-like esterase
MDKHLVNVVIVGDSLVNNPGNDTWPELLCKYNKWTYINIGEIGATSCDSVKHLTRLQPLLNENNAYVNESTLWIIQHGGNDVMWGFAHNYKECANDFTKFLRTKYGNESTKWMDTATTDISNSYYPACATSIARNTIKIMELAMSNFGAIKFLPISVPTTIFNPVSKLTTTICVPLHAEIILECITYTIDIALVRELNLFQETNNVQLMMCNMNAIMDKVEWMEDGLHPSSNGAKTIAIYIHSYLYGYRKMTPIVFKKDYGKLSETISNITTAVGVNTMQGIVSFINVDFHTMNMRRIRSLIGRDAKRVKLSYA